MRRSQGAARVVKIGVLSLGRLLPIIVSMDCRSFLSLAAALPIAQARRTAPDAVVETVYGKVRGLVDNGIRTFKGLRYGDEQPPPSGDSCRPRARRPGSSTLRVQPARAPAVPADDS